MADTWTMQSPDELSVPATLTQRRRMSSNRDETKFRSSNPVAKYKNWGRASAHRSWVNSFLSSAWVFVAPSIVLSSYVTMYQYDGDIFAFGRAVAEHGLGMTWATFRPQFSKEGTIAWLTWLSLQAVLFSWLPGPTSTGQHTPAGHLLTYKTNGMLAWVVTHVLLGALCWFGVLDPGFVVRNWSGLVSAMNATGLMLTVFAFVKAYVAPTHPNDRTFSGCSLLDFYMGIEMNPRIGKNFDLKLFNNGRPGLLGWTVIDLSNIAYQYQEFGRISPSLVLVTLLHSIYVVDFFLYENWYLRTIDIAHDHFGMYLAWGCFTWLPTMYTLQAQYLGHREPVFFSNFYLAGVTTIGLLGYAMFRSVNNQKDTARSSQGNCKIWGQPAKFITAKYSTSDGVQHQTILLCSGWWGYARHINYVGDLMLSFATCALVGTTKPLVWFYFLYMTTLLMHRCTRDEQRGHSKYGASWEEYCKRVPWRLIPGLW